MSILARCKWKVGFHCDARFIDSQHRACNPSQSWGILDLYSSRLVFSLVVPELKLFPTAGIPGVRHWVENDVMAVLSWRSPQLSYNQVLKIG